MLRKKGGIVLRLRLAPKTEEQLKEYTKREFKCSLEDKLQEVVISWIGKALEHIKEAIRI